MVNEARASGREHIESHNSGVSEKIRTQLGEREKKCGIWARETEEKAGGG